MRGLTVRHYLLILAVGFVFAIEVVAPPSIAYSQTILQSRFGNLLEHEKLSDPNNSDQNDTYTVAWSPNGILLAVGGQHSIWLYNNVLQFVKQIPTQIDIIHSLSWSPNGRLLAVGGSGSNIIQIFDIYTGYPTVVYHGHNFGGIQVIAWNPTNDSIASSTIDGDVQLWDGTTGKQLEKFPLQELGVSSLDWSSDGQRLLLAGARGIQILQVPGGKLLF